MWVSKVIAQTGIVSFQDLKACLSGTYTVNTHPWTERKTNTWVLEKLRATITLRADIITRNLSYFGHISRHQCMHTKNIMHGMVEVKRKRGKPAASWLDDIKLITGNTIADVTRAAADRRRWRFIIRTTPALSYAT